MVPLKIDIAGYSLALSSVDADRIDALRDGFAPFISSPSKSADFRVDIRFDLKNKKRGDFYISHVWGKKSVLINTPGFSADIDLTNKKIRVFSVPDYGVGGIIKTVLSALLVKDGGFLLHASAVLRKACRASYVFAGPSESGKTTIARIARDLVLTDETTAIKNASGRYRAHATPFSGEYGGVEENSSGALKTLFFINKGGSFSHRVLAPSEVVKRLFVNAMARTTDRETANRLLANFSRFAGAVPCHELFVKPTPELWRYIDEHIG